MSTPASAPKITRKELQSKIVDLYLSKGYVSPQNTHLLTKGNVDLSIEVLLEIPEVQKDLCVVDFDTENNTTTLQYMPRNFPLSGNLMGYQTLDNGLQFIGFSSGGDWEIPIFMIVYWDGNTFRGYIPTEGNTVNTIFKCAFGSEMDSEYGPYGSLAHVFYHKMYAGLEDDDLASKCAVDLGFAADYSDIQVDWSKIKNDLLKNIPIR